MVQRLLGAAVVQRPKLLCSFRVCAAQVCSGVNVFVGARGEEGGGLHIRAWLINHLEGQAAALKSSSYHHASH